MRRGFIAAVVALAVVVSACGGLSAEERAGLARLEGRWMCDVQRYTFADMAEIEAELEARVVGSGYQIETYRTFKEILAESSDLRDQVRQVYEEYCA